MIAKPRHRRSVNVRDLVIDNAIPDIFVAEVIVLNNPITMKLVIIVNKQLIIPMIATLTGGLLVRRLACRPRKNPPNRHHSMKLTRVRHMLHPHHMLGRLHPHREVMFGVVQAMANLNKIPIINAGYS